MLVAKEVGGLRGTPSLLLDVPDLEDGEEEGQHAVHRVGGKEQAVAPQRFALPGNVSVGWPGHGTNLWAQVGASCVELYTLCACVWCRGAR